jgi:hypothetical protein
LTASSGRAAGVARPSNYDIVRDVGAANQGTSKTFPVTVSDGTLTIAIANVVDQAQISAIELS